MDYHLPIEKFTALFGGLLYAVEPEFSAKVTPGMGETLPSVAEYFDVSVLGSFNIMCVVAKSTRSTTKRPLLCLLK